MRRNLNEPLKLAINHAYTFNISKLKGPIYNTNTFKLWYEFCICVTLNTLARSTKLWSNIGIAKWEQFQCQRHCKHGLWSVTSLEPEYLELRLISLTQIPHVDFAPQNMQEITKIIQNAKLTHIPSEQTTKSKKDEAWNGRTWGVQLYACPYCPTFNNQPSTFIKFTRWWKLAQTIKLWRAPTNPN